MSWGRGQLLGPWLPMIISYAVLNWEVKLKERKEWLDKVLESELE